MEFVEELNRVLPSDLPHRDEVVSKAARHLQLIVEANQYFNLTRITDVHDAVVKHVLDSVIPWRLFTDAHAILDVGTGAGYPGIPLALMMPGTRFTLAESIGKKARFVESVVKDLKLSNVDVVQERAEEILRKKQFPLITARAVAPIPRAADLFAVGLKPGVKALLYKGPDAEAEIATAAPELKKRGLRARVIEHYDLPDGRGTRTIVMMSR